MTDLSWIYCCIHDVHPTLKCCLEWEIMENVLNFDLESLHIISYIQMTLTGARAFAVFTGTKHPALAAAASDILSLMGYESSQWGDRTLHPRILTEQTFISMALKAMQPSWLNKSTFWQKRSLFAPEFLLRWTPGSWNCWRLQQHLPTKCSFVTWKVRAGSYLSPFSHLCAGTASYKGEQAAGYSTPCITLRDELGIHKRSSPSDKGWLLRTSSTYHLKKSQVARANIIKIDFNIDPEYFPSVVIHLTVCFVRDVAL